MTRENILRATMTALGMHSLTPDPGQDTGLGWTAKQEYLVYDAGDVATSKPGSRTPVTKVNNGWAVGAYLTNFNEGWAGSGWVMVACISTVPSSAALTGIAVFNGTHADFLGQTWYSYIVGQNNFWGGADYYDTDLPEINMNNAYFPPNVPLSNDFFLRIMEEAGVRLPKAFTRPVLSERR